MAQSQELAQAERLIQCDNNQWQQDLNRHLTQLGYPERPRDRVLEAVERFARASCMVIGPRGSGSGTLIGPERGVIVTNNHVLERGEEAGAQVVFNYTQDGRNNNCIVFRVEDIVSFSQPLQNLGDNTNFDYSFCKLDLNHIPHGHEGFLEDFALSDQSRRCTLVSEADHANVPLVMFGHPLGLARRMSLGTYPYPFGPHVRHQLPALEGSSGSSLFFPIGGFVPPLQPYPVRDLAALNTWRAVLLHWGCADRDHMCAVSWTSVGEHIRNNRDDQPVPNWLRFR